MYGGAAYAASMAAWFQVLDVMLKRVFGMGFVAAVEEDVSRKRVMLGVEEAEVRIWVRVDVMVGRICGWGC